MNKLIKQIARFILDGKLNWDMLDSEDKEYLMKIWFYWADKKHGSYEDIKSSYIENEIKKLIPCFFED